MEKKSSPTPSEAPNKKLEAWLIQRVTVCDELLADGNFSKAMQARADAFRETLEMMWDLYPETVPTCRVCGKEMGRSRSGRLTCSVKCRVAAHRAGV